MHALHLQVNPNELGEPESQQALDEAAAILKRGGTVALPTETVYGLGANALDASAIAAIFAAKERPGWDPLIVHVCDQAMLSGVVADIPENARRLMEVFWPGPLTLLLPRSAAVPDAVTAGRPLVGVRMPRHPVALEVIRRAGVPVAAPSANRFGRSSPTTAQHVLDDLDGRIDAVLDAGPTAFGLESTVLDPNVSPMLIYRPGAVSLEEIRKVAGSAELFVDDLALASGPREALPSPGIGLRHYAPKARLILIGDGAGLNDTDLASMLYLEAKVYSAERLGVMWPYGLPGEQSLEDSQDRFADFAEVYAWGSWSDPEALAQRLFAGLRHLDAAGCTVILCPVPPWKGIGEAIRDRLRKASWKERGES
jgi:L-threonylcarbamoyladenylate synthase